METNPMQSLLTACVVAHLVFTATPQAVADEWQATRDIEAAAEGLVASRAGTESATARAQPLDARLKLRRCDRELDADLRSGARVSRRTIAVVRCTGSTPWKVYVPVDVVVAGDVYVVRRSLPRGHVLTADDVERERRDLARVDGGYVADRGELVGLKLRQPLTAGSIVTRRALAVRTLIRRGQSVTLEARAGGIDIRMAGKALADGALGQRIRVENTASKRIVEGLVRSPERVEVLVN